VSRNDVILGVVALVLVGFSLVVSLVLPRRRPDFPGNRLSLFTLVAVALVAAMLTSVEVFGAEDHAEGGSGAEAEGAAHAEADPGEADTGAAGETLTGATEGEDEGGGGGGDGTGDVARGEQLFAEQGCGTCHTLEAAGTSGTVGPNLDEAAPSLDAAVEQITNGGGGMPAYGGQLSEEDIRALAAFVVESSQ
jgi:mono/diheme cytochrome c family protein